MKKWILTFKMIRMLIIQPSTSYFDVVEKVCREELYKHPDSFYAIWFLGDLYLQYKKFNEAVFYLEALLPLSQNKKLLFQLSRAYFNLCRYKDVVQVLSKFDKLPDKHAVTYYLGSSLIEIGQYAEGLQYLEKYSNSHPKDYMVLWKL
ncbi:MAG: CDC27 family protein [Thermodesulfobacteriota bacterium]